MELGDILFLIFISCFVIVILYMIIDKIIYEIRVNKLIKNHVSDRARLHKIYTNPNYNAFKLNESVIFIDKEDPYGSYNDIGKISFINRSAKSDPFFVKFEKYNDENKGKDGYCRCCNSLQLKSIDHLKFKKWVKGEK